MTRCQVEVDYLQITGELFRDGKRMVRLSAGHASEDVEVDVLEQSWAGRVILIRYRRFNVLRPVQVASARCRGASERVSPGTGSGLEGGGCGGALGICFCTWSGWVWR